MNLDSSLSAVVTGGASGLGRASAEALAAADRSDLSRAAARIGEVVGAGLAGLTVAREAARLGASVAVLEGRQVGWNASGHHLGTVMPGFGLPIADVIERVGLDDAQQLWALSKEGADYVRATATEDLIPGISPSDGALEVSNVDVGEALIGRLQTIGEEFATEVEGWQVDRVRSVLRTGRYFHGIYYPKAFQIDGRKYVHGLAALAVRAGKTRRFGFITTNSLRQTFNRQVLEPHLADPKKPLSLAFAIPDHPWVDAGDGAAVRIAMTVAAPGPLPGRLFTVIEEHRGEREAKHDCTLSSTSGANTEHCIDSLHSP